MIFLFTPLNPLAEAVWVRKFNKSWATTKFSCHFENRKGIPSRGHQGSDKCFGFGRGKRKCSPLVSSIFLFGFSNFIWSFFKGSKKGYRNLKFYCHLIENFLINSNPNLGRLNVVHVFTRHMRCPRVPR